MIIGNSKRSLLSQKEKSNKYYFEDYDIDLSNNNDSHSIIVNSIVNPNKILDVGCGVGFIGKKLKELYPKCVINGIEPDKKAAKICSKYYDNVLIDFVSIDSKSFLEFIKKHKNYDYIILADVLEHLDDPGEVLFMLSKALNKTGKMIVSVPNVAHIDIIHGLIDNDFNYNETGILDSTHKGFFTANSFLNMIENINENYSLKLGCKIIGKTFAKDDDKSDAFIFDIKGIDSYQFQTIFEIDNSGIISYEKKDENFKKINDNYLKAQKKEKKQSEEIETYKKKIIEQSEEIEINKKQIVEQSEKIVVYKKQVIRCEDKIKFFEDKCSSLTRENDELKDVIKRITGSKSWRITKPLRAVSKKIRGSK